MRFTRAPYTITVFLSCAHATKVILAFQHCSFVTRKQMASRKYNASKRQPLDDSTTLEIILDDQSMTDSFDDHSSR